MRDDLRERVAMAMAERDAQYVHSWVDWDECADAAITAVIEALAAEEEANDGSVFCLSLLPDDYVTENHELRLPDWLRSHLPTGRDGDATE